jgi:hypothetical protein
MRPNPRRTFGLASIPPPHIPHFGPGRKHLLSSCGIDPGWRRLREGRETTAEGERRHLRKARGNNKGERRGGADQEEDNLRRTVSTATPPAATFPTATPPGEPPILALHLFPLSRVLVACACPDLGVQIDIVQVRRFLI